MRAERLPELRTASSRRCRRRLVGAGGAGQTLSRVQLLDAAWDIAFESHSNVVDVYVRYLREKIDRPVGRNSVETVRGVGYRLRIDDTR